MSYTPFRIKIQNICFFLKFESFNCRIMNTSRGKTSLFVLAAALIMVLGVAQFCKAEESTTVSAIEECNKQTRSTLKKMHKLLTSCYSELKENWGEEDTHSRPWCAAKCLLIKDRLIDEKGLADDALLKNGMAGRVQPDKEARLLEMLLDCNKQLGSKLDPKDKFCKSYGDFGTCMHHAIADVCGTFYELP